MDQINGSYFLKVTCPSLCICKETVIGIDILEQQVWVYSSSWHRWTSLLKQQTSITVYHLPIKEKKLPFSGCRRQMEVCHFCFPFAANKWKLPFWLVPFPYIYIEMAAYIYVDIDI
jgi:hypothetical protein